MCSARNEPIERGAVVVIADRISEPTGKPRPAVVLQSRAFATSTLTICPITSIAADAPLLRIPLVADATTGVRVPSWAQVGASRPGLGSTSHR
jgi:mRNA interferase MazF